MSEKGWINNYFIHMSKSDLKKIFFLPVGGRFLLFF